jgi:hypothetical protein
VVTSQRPDRGVVAGKHEQVITFVESQPQPTGDRGHHLFGWLGPASAFQAAVVVGRHTAEPRDFLAPQAGSAAALTSREPDIVWLQRLTPHAEELRHVCPVHLFRMHAH